MWADQSTDSMLVDAPPPPEDTWRILIATDSHLGYLERDQIRRDDSFDALEEILCLAESEQVDFLLLGGDLFHDNNPSRYTLHRTMEILKRHCFGERAEGHSFQILSEQSIHFQRASYANMSDPHVQIKLPIFSIHGNHDDPGEASLAALDVLHVSSMINYFGKQEVADEITVQPLILRKGESSMAIYGLGNIRDERLGRMWASNRVHFADAVLPEDKPKKKSGKAKAHQSGSTSQSQKASTSLQTSQMIETSILNGSVDGRRPEMLSVLVLHQNRVPHGVKNFIPEKSVAQFDFVVWGHEHESIVQHTQRLDNEAYISQPGSSVATSLSEGEVARKHAVLLQVFKNQYAVTPLPLRTVRPFRLEHVDLSASNISPNLTESEMNDAIAKYLAARIETIIQQINNETCTDGSNPRAIWTNSKLPLIRLKVNYTGFNVINTKRFGQDFVSRVANPAELLQFHAKRTIANASNNKKNTIGTNQSTSAGSLAEADALLELAPQHAKIEEFLEEQLNNNLGTNLGIFHSTGFIRALQTYAEKEGGVSSLAETLEKQLKEVQLHVLSQTPLVQTRQDVRDVLADYNRKLTEDEEIAKRTASTLNASTTSSQASHAAKSTAAAHAKRPLSILALANSITNVKAESSFEEDDYEQFEALPPANRDFGMDTDDGIPGFSLDDSEEDLVAPASEGRKRPASKRTASQPKKAAKQSSAAAKAAAAAAKHTPSDARTTARTVAPSSAPAAISKAKTTAPASSPFKPDPMGPPAPRRPTNDVIVIDDDEEDARDLDETYAPQHKRPKAEDDLPPIFHSSQTVSSQMTQLPNFSQASSIHPTTSSQTPVRAKRTNSKSGGSQKKTGTQRNTEIDSPASLVRLDDASGESQEDSPETFTSPTTGRRWARR